MKKHKFLLNKLVNPVLRPLGWSLVSVFEGDRFIKYMIRPYPKYCAKVN